MEKKNPSLKRKGSSHEKAQGNVLNMQNYGSISSIVGKNMQSHFDEKNKHSFKAQLHDLNMNPYEDDSPGYQKFNSVTDCLKPSSATKPSNF